MKNFFYILIVLCTYSSANAFKIVNDTEEKKFYPYIRSDADDGLTYVEKNIYKTILPGQSAEFLLDFASWQRTNRSRPFEIPIDIGVHDGKWNEIFAFTRILTVDMNNDEAVEKAENAIVHIMPDGKFRIEYP